MEPTLERRRRLTHRALPLGGLAAAALVAGIGFGSAFESGPERVAAQFARAWSGNDYAAMHRLLATDAQAGVSLDDFTAAYERARAVATAVAVEAGDSSVAGDGEVKVPVTVRTRMFGTIESEFFLPIDEDERVRWAPHLVFPGLAPGDDLSRSVEVPPRADILSRDGEVLVEGPVEARTSPPDGIGSSIAGTVTRSEDADERQELFARGFGEDTPVGASGLERALQREVEGRPGGALLAGSRVLARSPTRPAGPVRSTIDTDIQAAAVTALAGRLGGIAALDPITGEVRALAGVAFSAPQPPGSTFKLVTTTAALDSQLVKPSDEFEVVSSALIDGVPLENANGELCGGTFTASFAHSCNSVFAPLGVEVGAESLVAMAERFGWNEEPAISGAEQSTLPQAGEMTSPLEIGSSAIGQGRVLATPLQMASVAQTIANGGVRETPTLLLGGPRESRRVTSRRTARTIERLMVGVVEYGTGTAAAIDGVKVAGKTGTAELGDTRGPEAVESDASNTDAWFTSYAPAGKPEIVVAVLFVRNGAGGAVAAPAAQPVLVAGLKEK
ncbi:MAG: penicillin-binding transpeptidase domain-containing protein [Actinomycetota bacterium]|nr:penicillin-binding transpeptidase domain-containing protein [Actinomycetota bacterium]